jgi:hypothetical protein
VIDTERADVEVDVGEGALTESEREGEDEIPFDEEEVAKLLPSDEPVATAVLDLMTEVASCFLTSRPLFPSPPKICLLPEFHLLLQTSLAYSCSCAATSCPHSSAATKITTVFIVCLLFYKLTSARNLKSRAGL